MIPTKSPIKRPSVIQVKPFDDDYQVISELGSGSYGYVCLARFCHDESLLLKNTLTTRDTLMQPLAESYSKPDRLVAIKTMTYKLKSLAEYSKLNEIKFILNMPSHPNLVQVYEIFIDPYSFLLHIVMEKMSCSLHDLLVNRSDQPFSPITLKSILSQILGAVRHVHDHNFIHRDIKPHNVLVIPTFKFYGSAEATPPHKKNDNYTIKLADYGLSRHINDLHPFTTYVATRWYRSPELLLQQKLCSKPTDIWSFGVLAAEVANLAPLFPGNSDVEQLWRVLELMGSPSLEHTLGGLWKEAIMLAAKLGISFPLYGGADMSMIIPQDHYSDVRDVISRCLVWDPKARADIHELCEMDYFKNTSIQTQPDTILPHLLHNENDYQYHDFDDGYDLVGYKDYLYEDKINFVNPDLFLDTYRNYELDLIYEEEIPRNYDFLNELEYEKVYGEEYQKANVKSSLNPVTV